MKELLAEQPRIHAILLYTLYFQVLDATPLPTFIATLMQPLQTLTLPPVVFGAAHALLEAYLEEVAEASTLAMTTTILLEQRCATLVPELYLAHQDTIVILPRRTPHALALAQMVAAVLRTVLLVVVTINLVKHALELDIT